MTSETAGREWKGGHKDITSLARVVPSPAANRVRVDVDVRKLSLYNIESAIHQNPVPIGTLFATETSASAPVDVDRKRLPYQ